MLKINAIDNICGEHLEYYKLDDLERLMYFNGLKIFDAEYNKEIGSSYYKWDKTGSWLLTDNATKLPQSIQVDKTNGKISIISGKTSLVINKAEESYAITNKKTIWTSSEEFAISTKKLTINAQDSCEITTKDIKTSGKLAQKGNTTIDGDIKHTGKTEHTGDVKVTGALEATGEVKLGGGANPLIYEILMIIGTGNAGLPVLSTATVLKTVMTKAT
jgi:hypothetical protein